MCVFRDLGLDDLLKHCEGLLEKLRFPEKDPCFHAMAGTLLYTHTALEMLHNYNRYERPHESSSSLRGRARLHVPMSFSLCQDHRSGGEGGVAVAAGVLQSPRPAAAPPSAARGPAGPEHQPHSFTSLVLYDGTIGLKVLG